MVYILYDFGFDKNEISHDLYIFLLLFYTKSEYLCFRCISLGCFATAAKKIDQFEIRRNIHGQEFNALQICIYKVVPISYRSLKSRMLIDIIE